MTPLFSIVMPSFLGEYPSAASNRDSKIRRAIDSVLSQTFMGWELILVSDGCEKTCEIYDRFYANSQRIHLSPIAKQPLWCAGPRNRGIADAEGKYIAYLDIDDYWKEDHLATLKAAIERTPLTSGWGYFNAYYYDNRLATFIEKPVNIEKCAGHGTGNIVHENIPGLLWPQPPKDRMGERIVYHTQDCAFVDVLKKRGPGTLLPTPGYMVCHEPHLLKIDV